jgi:Zn-dependent protease
MHTLLPHFPFWSALLVAISVHGLGHWLAARATGVHMNRLIRTRTGLCLVADSHFSSYDTELYCALGGPLANAAAALLCRLQPISSYPFTRAFIPLSLYLGLLNLLPLQGFDGARILYCLLCAHHRHLPSLSPTAAQRLVSIMSCLLLMLLWLLSVYLLLRCGSALSLYVFCAQLFCSVALDNRPKSKHLGEFGSISKDF